MIYWKIHKALAWLLIDNSLWPSDAIRQQRSGSTLAQVRAWCYLKLCVVYYVAVVSISLSYKLLTHQLYIYHLCISSLYIMSGFLVHPSAACYVRVCMFFGGNAWTCSRSACCLWHYVIIAWIRNVLMCPNSPDSQEIAANAGVKWLAWTNPLLMLNLLYVNTNNHLDFLSFVTTDAL